MKRGVIFPVVLISVLAVGTINGCHCNLHPPTPTPKDGAVVGNDELLGDAALAVDAAGPGDAGEPIDADEGDDDDALDTTCLLPPCAVLWSDPAWPAYVHQCLAVGECRTFMCPHWETQATFCNNPDPLLDAGVPAAKAKPSTRKRLRGK